MRILDGVRPVYFAYGHLLGCRHSRNHKLPDCTQVLFKNREYKILSKPCGIRQMRDLLPRFVGVLSVVSPPSLARTHATARSSAISLTRFGRFRVQIMGRLVSGAQFLSGDLDGTSLLYLWRSTAPSVLYLFSRLSIRLPKKPSPSQ